LTTIKIIIIISILTLIGCEQTELKSSFIDNINKGDTLTLSARFADCGEWGGHIEKIQITKVDNKLDAIFYKDTVSCETDPNLTRKKTIEISEPLSIAYKNCIVKYIDSLLVRSNRNIKSIGGNSSNIYELISKDKTYRYLDFEQDWQGFTEMRNEIFTEYKANR
jgi:hypothetical protein